MSHEHVLIAGQWRAATASQTFQAHDPKTNEPLAGDFPVSDWADCDAALTAAAAASDALRQVKPATIAAFLEDYAQRIEACSDEICALATKETGLPLEPRLKVVELPRTSNQLRAAAAAARDQHWTRPVIDSAANIRTQLGSIGPVLVFGPNNFPLAFGSVSGGDFAAAIAAGNPVIAKAHPLHPGTTRLLAEQAHVAAEAAGLPAGTVQLLYSVDFADGERLVQDPRLAAVAFTGSRNGGLKLKAAADAVGKPIFLELGSVNPVVMLPGALAERSEAIVTDFVGSCLMGTGQFCTNPGLVLLPDGQQADAFADAVVAGFAAAPCGVLFSAGGLSTLEQSLVALQKAGATVRTGGAKNDAANSHQNTVLEVRGSAFVEAAPVFNQEAFGNATLIVRTSSIDETRAVIRALEGNLTGCIYTATNGDDDAAYDALAPDLRQKVGRLINDKMPTGVAVSPAMNHGGPFPATGHPGFTAVGIPASLTRFAMLQCYDGVREHRLPSALRDANPDGVWRSVDGVMTQAALS